jgi:MFS family permease
MEQVAINWFAIITAALVGFAVGALWYGPLFGKIWMAEVGLTEEDAQKANMVKIFGIAFVLQFIMAYCLAMFFGNDITLITGALYGFLTGFAWVAFAITVNAMFEQKSWKYILINGGYWTIVFTLMGLIIGVWR